MSSKSKLSARLLSNAIARQCVVARQPAAAANQSTRQLHSRPPLKVSSQCNAHHTNRRRATEFRSTSASSSWRRQPHPQPQHWRCCQPHRHFTTEPTAEGDHYESMSMTREEYSTPASISDEYDNDSSSLHSNIHYILHKIKIGRMNDHNLQKARAFLSITSKWHNEQGATLSEALLERLYQEQTSAGVNNYMTDYATQDDVVIDSEMYAICMDAWNKANDENDDDGNDNVDGERIVDRVQSIMDRMEERYFRSLDGDDNDDDDYGNNGSNHHEHLAPRPNRICYNCLINAYSKWDNDEDSSSNTSTKVEGILEKMTALADDAASSDKASDKDYEALIRPDAVTYNSVMNYYATRKNQHLSAQRAEDLLLRISELSQQQQQQGGGGGGTVEMSATSFNIVLKAWSNSGTGIHGAQRAESVLQMMIKLYGRGHKNVRPDSVSFSTVIHAYSKVDPEDGHVAVERVMELLDELEGTYLNFHEEDNGSSVNTCYNAAANVIVKSGVDDAADRVKELMDRMKNRVAVVPDGNMYVSQFEALANEGGDDSFERSKELLLEIVGGLEPKLQSSNPAVPFNILLNVTLKGDAKNKFEQAEELMALMEKVGGNARPGLRSYSMMISALSRSDQKDSEQKAVDLLRNMLKSYREGYQNAKPNSFIFNCIIGMLTRSKQDWTNDVIYNTLMAMENQQKKGNTTVVPDVITYNLVIGKLAQRGTKENAKKVMKILATMEENAESNEAMSPDIITYTNVLRLQEKVNPMRAAYIASSCLERAMLPDKKMPIDRLGFQTLLLALSKSNKLEHATMARKAWEWMEKSDRKSKNKKVLDSSLCNLVLIAYGKSQDVKAAGEALTFLSGQIVRYNGGDKTTILPTMVGFGAALGCLGKAHRVDDALRLLKIMKALTKDGIPNITPDERCYASILGPLAKSQADNAPSQALRIVKLMKEDLGQIPTAALNAAISTCSRKSGSPSKDVETAFELFQLGKESRDAVTFGLMIRTCMMTQKSDDMRLKLVEPLFKLCAKSGLVGNMVVRELKHLKRRLIVNNQIPPGWTINAKD